MRKVSIRRIRMDARADCESCSNLPPDAARHRARLHTEMTGHTVRVVVKDITIYRKVSE